MLRLTTVNAVLKCPSMLARTNPAILDDLRFALDVLEESSHLGLDSKYAAKLKTLIEGQITRGEQVLKRLPVHAVAAQSRRVTTEFSAFQGRKLPSTKG